MFTIIAHGVPNGNGGNQHSLADRSNVLRYVLSCNSDINLYAFFLSTQGISFQKFSDKQINFVTPTDTQILFQGNTSPINLLIHSTTIDKIKKSKQR